MAETNGKTMGARLAGIGDSVNSVDSGRVGLAGEEGMSGDLHDSMMNTAQMFEAQLEQMTAWKHQLSQQMELLRRDGVKLLERQKNLAIEKQRLAEEREVVSGDRAYVQKLHAEVEEQSKRLKEEGERIAGGLAELEKLAAEKGKWEQEIASARNGAAAAIQETELARRRKTDFEAAAGLAEERAAEVRGLEEKQATIAFQVAAAEATLGVLREELEKLETQRLEVAAKQSAVEARERDIAEREESEGAKRREGETAILAEQERLARERAEVAAGRVEIETAMAALLEDRHELEARVREIEGQAAAMTEGAQRERAAAGEKIAEAKAALAELNGERTRQDQRWIAIEARAAELAVAEEIVQTQARGLAVREETWRTEKQAGDEAQAKLLSQQEALIGAERLLSEKIAVSEGELAEKIAAAELAKRQLDAEREGLATQRAELEKKLDLMEGELAEQFAAVAKQTKRLTDRRADLDARSAAVERDVETRVARATEGLQEELGRAKKNYEESVRNLREEMERAQGASGGWQVREATLTEEVARRGDEVAGLKAELAKAGAELDEVSRGRMETAEILAEQVMRFERESADWQGKLERALAEAGQNAGLAQTASVVEAARGDIERLTRELAEVGAARDEAAARGAELETLAEELVAKLREAEGQIERLKGLTKGQVGDGRILDETLREEALALAAQVKMLEAQREDLVGQLFGVQEALRRQSEEALLSRNGLQAEIQTLRSRGVGSGAKFGEGHLAGARGKLLRKARHLRAYRKQVQSTKGELAKNSEDVARQREQLRSRKENLEQVKRLLEKQEMVMARKLADHNALKTVAAVGIFLIMILGSAFFGVYKFVQPTFRSEAVVQLAPPPGLQGLELKAWLTRQMEFVRSPEVTFAAWKILRSESEHYSMHDVRDEWAASLPKQLTMTLDAEARHLSISYTGPNPDGVSQVCNALAMAYVTPGNTEGTDVRGPAGVGGGAMILAKATPPQTPFQDNRLMTSMTVAAAAMLVSLLLVMVFRHYVARQLREIDRMADEQDLADLKGEMG